MLKVREVLNGYWGVGISIVSIERKREKRLQVFQ